MTTEVKEEKYCESPSSIKELRRRLRSTLAIIKGVEEELALYKD